MHGLSLAHHIALVYNTLYLAFFFNRLSFDSSFEMMYILSI